MTEDIITMTIQEPKIVPPTITITKDKYDLLIAQANRRDVCWHCGGRLIWNGDNQTTDSNVICTSLTCQQCGADVDYYIRGGSE